MAFDTSPSDELSGVSGPVHISLDSLPPGTKQGDTIPMMVKLVDKGTNVAHLIPAGSSQPKDMPLETGSPEGSDQDSNGTGTASAPSSQLGTEMTLGPLGQFKSYLARKSVDAMNR